MEEGFAGQFLRQVWPILFFIVGMIGLMIATTIWQARRRQSEKQQKRAKIDGTAGKKSKSAKRQKQSVPATGWAESVSDSEPFSSILDEYDDPLEANRLSDLLAEPVENDFETFMAASQTGGNYEQYANLDDDDPLAELSQAREVAEQERTLAADEEIVELASLLAGLGDEAEETAYHTIGEAPIAVKVGGGMTTYAKEYISILRDERDERLIVQIGETGFRTLLDDKDAKSTFTKVMKELSGIILKPDESSDLDNIAADADSYHEILAEPVAIKLHGDTETDALELMSIMRDERDARLMLQMGDTAYRSLAKEKENKSIFTKTMKEVAAVILTVDDNPPQAKTQPKPQASERVPDKVANIIRDAQRDDDEEIPGVLNIPKMDDLEPTHSVGRFGRVQVKKPIEKVPELNIAEAIEKYLQYKIESNPQFQNRGIHVQQAYGGVRITVDGQSYDFVDEVEDVEARNFIQQAINEWQEQH